MNVDDILRAMNQQSCRYLLFGGMNFMLRHQPVLTYDVDLWIDDTAQNRRLCEQALIDLDAQWGATESTWGPVTQIPSDWLNTQQVFCLASSHGAIDIFRQVDGLPDWDVAYSRSLAEVTAAGTSYRGLSDQDMLQCQLALAEGLQKLERIRVLRQAVEKQKP